MGTTRRALHLVAAVFATLAMPSIAVAQARGSDLMTEEERLEHRRRVQEAETWEERERAREEHEEMKERARERGVEIPDEPPTFRRPGPGPAPGYGRGPGYGPGMRRGPRGPGRGYGPHRRGGWL